MDKNIFQTEIDKQIFELGEVKTYFCSKKDRFEGFVAIDKIDSKIIYIRRKYYFYLVLSLVLGGLLYIAGFAQVFEFKFVGLSKSGLLIILVGGNIVLTIRNKIDLEKLKMIKYLLGLKQLLEKL